MSQGEQEITCRRCSENIPANAGNCPHCGASIRSTGKLLAVMALGVVLGIAALIRPGDLLIFGVLGLLFVGISGYLVYDQRQRMSEASEEQEAAFGADSDSDNF